MMFVHVPGGGISPAAGLRAALFPKAPSAQAAAVPTQVCLHGSLLAADLNENVSTNPSGFPTRTTTKKGTRVPRSESAGEAVCGAVEVLLQNTEHRWR